MNKNQKRYLVRWLVFEDENTINEFGAVGCDSYERALEIEEALRPIINPKLQGHPKNKFEVIQEGDNVHYEEA